MVNTEQKSNLARTAIYLLTESPFELQMKWFFKSVDRNLGRVQGKEKYECGTTCCFAGHGPPALDNLLSCYEDWNDYVVRTYGNERGQFAFLFDEDWANDKHQVAARALTYLENHAEFENWVELHDRTRQAFTIAKFFEELSEAELVERLKKYV